MKKLVIVFIIVSSQFLFAQENWQKLNLPSISNLHLSFSDSTDGIITIFNDGKLYRSTSRGDDWELKSTSTNNRDLFENTIDRDNNIIGKVSGPGGYTGPGYFLVISSDFGASWDTITSNYYSYEFGHHFFNPSNQAIYISSYDFYPGIGGLYYTTNLGISWELIPNSPFGWYIVLPWVYLPEHRIVLSELFNVFKTSDNGYTWNESEMIGNNYEQINGLAVNVQEKIYVIFENSGVYTAEFDSLNFNFLGLNNKKLSSLAVKDSQVFVSSDSLGVYQYDSPPDNWLNVSNGLEDLKIINIFFDKVGNLYARTRTGLFRAKSNLTAVKDKKIILLNFNLAQNYPNPFNPSTKISWQSPVSGWQTLKVYDVLGNEVATLVNEYRTAGSYEVEFKSIVSSRQLANGVYFYQLKAGDYVETKKMILLK